MDAFLYTTYVQGALPWDKPMSIANGKVLWRRI